jgi:hypothetical protein
MQPEFNGLTLDILQDALGELTTDCVVALDIDISIFPYSYC